jgi:hypothetical protein
MCNATSPTWRPFFLSQEIGMNRFCTAFIALVVAFLAAGAAQAQYGTKTPPMGATGVDTSHIKTKPRSEPTTPDQPASLTGQVQVVLDKLEDDLRIGAGQQKAWDVYRAKVMRFAEDLTRARYSARDMQDGGMTVPQQLERLSEIASNRATAVDEIVDAGRAVYATLGSEQKRVADKDLVLVPLRLVSGNAAGTPIRPEELAQPNTKKGN